VLLKIWPAVLASQFWDAALISSSGPVSASVNDQSAPPADI